MRLKKEIRCSLSSRTRDIVNRIAWIGRKDSSNQHMQLSEKTMDKSSQFKAHLLRVAVNYCLLILVLILVINMIPSAIMYTADKLRNPLVAWVANSIQNEGVVYNALIAIGDYKIIYAMENFYLKRGSTIDINRFKEIRNVLETLK